jgi:hypothetical protein
VAFDSTIAPPKEKMPAGRRRYDWTASLGEFTAAGEDAAQT